MLKDFKVNRKILSSYYIAVIFMYFIFIVFGGVIMDLIKEFGRFINENASVDFVNNGRFWWFFVAVCFVLVTFLRIIVVEPLGFFVDSEDEPWWETFIFGIIVSGFFIFLINQTFEMAMPSAFPTWVTKLFGGYKNTYLPLSTKNEFATSGWYLVPGIWYLTPILFMYIRRKINIKK